MTLYFIVFFAKSCLLESQVILIVGKSPSRRFDKSVAHFIEQKKSDLEWNNFFSLEVNHMRTIWLKKDCANIIDFKRKRKKLPVFECCSYLYLSISYSTVLTHSGSDTFSQCRSWFIGDLIHNLNNFYSSLFASQISLSSNHFTRNVFKVSSDFSSSCNEIEKVPQTQKLLFKFF